MPMELVDQVVQISCVQDDQPLVEALLGTRCAAIRESLPLLIEYLVNTDHAALNEAFASNASPSQVNTLPGITESLEISTGLLRLLQKAIPRLTETRGFAEIYESHLK